MKTVPNITPTKCSTKLSRPMNGSAAKTNLANFPGEILESVLSMCSSKDRNSFRNVCQRFREVHRDFVVHSYKVVCKRIGMKSSAQRRNRIAIVSRVLYDVNRPFMQVADMCVSFYSGTIDLFESLHRAVMSYDLIDMLNQFYDDAETMLAAQSFNVSYLISLLSLLNQFSNVSKSSQRAEFTRIHLKFVIRDIWYIIVWPNDGRLLDHPKESRSILIMITILLINEKFHRPFYELVKYGSRTMIYGGATTRRPTCSVTFEIGITGDASIIDYFAENETCKNAAYHEMPLHGGHLTDATILFRCKETSRLNSGHNYAIRF